MVNIDIIVPVYKVEKYLDRCVWSLLEQTCQGIRIILVDDGSPDNCGAMCDDYAAAHDNVVVIHKENGGLSSARNAGLEIVQAPYVMFVDSDDFIYKTTCEIMLKIAQKEQADVVKFGLQVVDEATCTAPDKLYGDAYNINKNDRKEWLLTFGHVCNKLYKSSIVKDVRFPLGLVCEDYYFSAIVSQRIEKLVEVEDAYYFYRMNPTSITHKVDSKHTHDKFRILELIIDYYHDNGKYEEYCEYLEYLYTMVCFVNYCKTAVISYENPVAYVKEASKRIRNEYPRFAYNRLYKQRCLPRVRLMAFMMLHCPTLFVGVAKILMNKC